MKNIYLPLVIGMLFLSTNCASQELQLDRYPHATLVNDHVTMKVYLPDRENGLYRATRFDWSGVIETLTYQGHEYFGYWKDTHDPLYHEDLPGPVEGYIKPGLGYEEAEAGEGFIRIGIGVLEKEAEQEYNWRKTYKILDHGSWKIEQEKDRISFTHELSSNFGFGYVYQKTIRLKHDGFSIEHHLKNTGEKLIETDQFNHNFFMIDGEKSGPAFTVSFPWEVSTVDDPKGYIDIQNTELSLIKEFRDTSVFLALTGYSEEVTEHEITVLNQTSGAGVRFTVDKPLHRMAFWACETTLCPENFIWISVAPDEEENWTSDYTLFVKGEK
ncbi:MAG: hypothetical protein AAF587_24970 [Bacteroidota bacterium]